LNKAKDGNQIFCH